MEIRLALPDDAAAIRDIYAPVVTDTAISFEVDVPSIEEMRSRILNLLPEHPWLVAAQGAGILGYAYARPFATRAAYRWSVETSVYVALDAQRRGVGRSLYRALFGILPLQGYRRAFAGIALPNPASVALHTGTGFTPVGTYRRVGWKMGAWHDVGWWSRVVVADGADPPDPPVPLDRITGAQLSAVLANPSEDR